MRGLSTDEAAAVERCAGEPMLDQVQAWAAVNSGSRNLSGLAEMARIYVDAFAALPGEVALLEPTPVEAMTAEGRLHPIEHGRNLHVRVRPEAPVQLLFTGHMDTVYGADHSFQTLAWREEAFSEDQVSPT
jgi:glutamate carboxypeptidase